MSGSIDLWMFGATLFGRQGYHFDTPGRFLGIHFGVLELLGCPDQTKGGKEKVVSGSCPGPEGTP
jgi:hypothetical protein